MDRLRRRRGRNRSNIGHAKVTLHGSHNEVKIGSQRSHNIGSDFSKAQRALAREVTVLANVGDYIIPRAFTVSHTVFSALFSY